MAFEWPKPKYVPLYENDGDTDVEKHRVAFKVLNEMDATQMRRNRRDLVAKLNEKFGDFKDLDSDDQDVYLVALSQIVQACAVNAALALFEEKIDDEWHPIEIPESWQDVSTFIESAPSGFIDDLYTQVIAAGNPRRLFTIVPANEEEEKKIRIYVPKSES